jgi:hypothetical protein
LVALEVWLDPLSTMRWVFQAGSTGAGFGEELDEGRRAVGDDDLGMDGAVGDVHRGHQPGRSVADVLELS